MAKTRVLYTCQQCGNESAKWFGRCPECGAWNSYVEGLRSPAAPAGTAPDPRSRPGAARPERLADVSVAELERVSSGLQEFDRVLGDGIVPGSLVLVGGDPGIGKCLVGDARVLDPASGAFTPISEWTNGSGTVLALDEATGRLLPRPVSSFHDQGVRPIVALETRLGRTLRCTPNHPVLTPEGWRTVSELAPGTRIATPRALTYFGSEELPEHHVKLLAYALSDGSATSAIGVTAALSEVEADLQDVAMRFGQRLRVYPKPRTRAKQLRFVTPPGQRAQARQVVMADLRRAQAASGMSWAAWARAAAVDYGLLNQWRRGTCVPSEAELARLAQAAGVPLAALSPEARDRADMRTSAARLLESVGLRYKTARSKAVPSGVFRLSREQLALFLKVLFSCDGSVWVNQAGQPSVSYSTISHQLAEDVQHLLLRFGFVARLRTKQSRVAGRPYQAYELQLLGTPAVRRFLAEIGIWGREVAKARIAAMPGPLGRSTHADTIPTGQYFWAHLRMVSGSASFKDISERAGVWLRNRRHDRPLQRATVAALATAYEDGSSAGGPALSPWPSPQEGVGGEGGVSGAASRYLTTLAKGDIYWDEIVRVTPAGEARVYDLTVPGEANFVANDLIVHNSTLLLQVATNVAAAGRRVLYVSGEESARQVRLRSERLGTVSGDLYVLAETSLDAVLAQVEALEPDLLIVDSIQTVYIEGLAASPGNVSQLRECALRLMGVAKTRHLPVFLVGHVTKEGNIAGPRSLEHIVDCVLYLEGERFYAYRLLRAEKNRFGSTNEIGVFEMEADGLRQVLNPSAAFLSERQAASAGSAVTVPLEGSRAILVEVQSLVTGSGLAMPRRTAIGVDLNRLHLLLAVLGKRVGLPLGSQDVYVNVVAGIKIAEPAADLGLALAIASSWRDAATDPGLVVVGEVGLLGELRPVRQLERRLAEAGRLGFERCIVPAGDLRRLIGPPEGGGGRRVSRSAGEVRRDGLLVQGAATVGEALTLALGPALDVRGGGRGSRDGGRGRGRSADGAEEAGIDRFQEGRGQAGQAVNGEASETLEPVE